MDYFERIPVDVRWKIAGRELSALPIAYRAAFRRAADDQLYNEIEREIWREQGREVNVIATAFRMPRRTAREVADAFMAGSRLLFGPEFIGDVRETAPDRAVLTMRSCPLVSRAMEMGEDPLVACNVCHAYANAAIAHLNDRYALRYTGGICTGDTACTMTIGPERPEA